MLGGLAVVLFISRRLATDLASATAAAEAVADGRPLPPARAHVAEISQLQRSLATGHRYSSDGRGSAMKR